MVPLLTLTSALMLSTSQPPTVQHVKLPHGSQVAEAIARPDGQVWVAYGREGEIYFQTLKADGQWSGDEVRVSSAKNSALIGSERGPHMSVGKDNVIHIIWTGRKGFGVAYTRSLNGGKTWEPQRNLLEPKMMAEGPTVSSDAEGNVVAAWLDGRLGETKESPVSFALIVRQSTDNGKSFSAAAAVSDSAEDRACMCCELTSIVSADGTFGIAHRKAFKNVRDMTMWLWKPGGGDWRRSDVSDDGWNFAGCPMTGAGLSQLPKGGVAVAWMSEGVVYLSSLDSSGDFAARKRISARDGSARHVGLAVAADGRRLVTWRDKSVVRWNLLDADGTSLNHGQFAHAGTWKACAVANGKRLFVIF